MSKKKETQEVKTTMEPTVEPPVEPTVEPTAEQPVEDTTTEPPVEPATEPPVESETEPPVEPVMESLDTLISNDVVMKQEKETTEKSKVSEIPLYYVNTTENEVMIRSEPNMLNMGNVAGLIKEAPGNKKNYGIVEECKGFGRIQDTKNWIYLKFTKKVTRIA